MCFGKKTINRRPHYRAERFFILFPFSPALLHRTDQWELKLISPLQDFTARVVRCHQITTAGFRWRGLSGVGVSFGYNSIRTALLGLCDRVGPEGKTSKQGGWGDEG